MLTHVPAAAATTPAAPAEAEAGALVPTHLAGEVLDGKSGYPTTIPHDDRLATPGALDLQTVVSRSEL